jgi:hypothetical protein
VLAFTPRQEHLNLTGGVVSFIGDRKPEVPRLSLDNDRIAAPSPPRNFIRITSPDSRSESEYRVKLTPLNVLAVQREEQCDHDRRNRSDCREPIGRDHLTYPRRDADHDVDSGSRGFSRSSDEVVGIRRDASRFVLGDTSDTELVANRGKLYRLQPVKQGACKPA